MKVKLLDAGQSRAFYSRHEDTNDVIIENEEYYPKAFKLVEKFDDETNLPEEFSNHVFKYHDDGNIFYEIKDKEGNVIFGKKVNNRRQAIGILNGHDNKKIHALSLCHITNLHTKSIKG